MAEQGDIVIIVDLLDPQGRNPKDWACVIRLDTRAGRGGRTARRGGDHDGPCPTPLPFDHIPLPWHAQRHPRTGLDKRNAAVCSWLVAVDAARVARKIGHVPTHPRYSKSTSSWSCSEPRANPENQGSRRAFLH